MSRSPSSSLGGVGGLRLVRLLVMLCCTTSASVASAVTTNSNTANIFPPAWTHNKTEWRSRLYNSLRLTPWQVELLEGALDARDALKAPLSLAADGAALAIADAAFAARREHANSTFRRAVATPLERAANETVFKVEKARVDLLNKTEIALRAGVNSISSSPINSTSRRTPSRRGLRR